MKLKMQGIIEPLGSDENGVPMFNTYVTINGRQMAWDSAEFKRRILSKFIGDVDITIEEQSLIPTVSKETSHQVGILAKGSAAVGTLATAGGILWGWYLSALSSNTDTLSEMSALTREASYATLTWQAGLMLTLLSLLAILIRNK